MAIATATIPIPATNSVGRVNGSVTIPPVGAAGTGAVRQRAAFRRSANLEDVTGFTLEETAKC